MTPEEKAAFREWRKRVIARHEQRPLIKAFREIDERNRAAKAAK